MIQRSQIIVFYCTCRKYVKLSKSPKFLVFLILGVKILTLIHHSWNYYSGTHISPKHNESLNRERRCYILLMRYVDMAI